MANYPLIKTNKEGTLYLPLSTYYSDEYAERMCDLHIRSEVHDEGHGVLNTYYRLHAMHPHNIEMALAYDIQCPKCSHLLKQVGRCRDSHELGLYTCPVCNRR